MTLRGGGGGEGRGLGAIFKRKLAGSAGLQPKTDSSGGGRVRRNFVSKLRFLGAFEISIRQGWPKISPGVEWRTEINRPKTPLSRFGWIGNGPGVPGIVGSGDAWQAGQAAPPPPPGAGRRGGQGWSTPSCGSARWRTASSRPSPPASSCWLAGPRLPPPSATAQQDKPNARV